MGTQTIRRSETALVVLAMLLAAIGVTFALGAEQPARGDLPSLLGVAPDADGNTVLAALAAAAASSSGMYIKFDGVDGESRDQAHTGWSDLQSFAWSAHRTSGNGVSGSTRQRGSTTLGDVVVVRELDKASPKLAQVLSEGTSIATATMDFTTQMGDLPETYYLWELKNVRVTSYAISGSVGEVPVEEVSFTFSEIRVIYTEFDDRGVPKGNVEYSWKVEEGTK